MRKFIFSLLVMVSFNSFASVNLACVGTEPFFRSVVSSQTIHFELLGTQALSQQVLNKTDARGTKDFAFKVSSPNMSANIITGDCNDGMSDRIYNYHLLLEVGREVYYGCCNKI